MQHGCRTRMSRRRSGSRRAQIRKTVRIHRASPGHAVAERTDGKRNGEDQDQQHRRRPDLGMLRTGLTRAEKETGKATGPGENEQYPLGTPTTCETTPTHVWDPQDVNGSNLGNLQSTLIFNQRSGTGPSCANGAVTALVTGSFKVIGYDGSEL